MIKWFHNDKFALGWAWFVEILAHGFFAVQAFLIGGFLGELALTTFLGAKIGALLGALLLALFIFGAAFQAFVLGEYTKEHVEAYEYESGKGDGSYISSWKQIRYIVGGIEIASLAFRSFTILQQGGYTSVGAIVLSVINAAFGGLLLWYAFAQAKIIHASVNRPVEYDIAQSQEHAGRTLNERALQYIPKMTPEQLARYKAGDTTAVEEVATSDFFAQEQKRQARQEKIQEKATKKQQEEIRSEQGREKLRRARGTANNIFNPLMWSRKKDTPLDNDRFTDALSSPGHHQSNGSR